MGTELSCSQKEMQKILSICKWCSLWSIEKAWTGESHPSYLCWRQNILIQNWETRKAKANLFLALFGPAIHSPTFKLGTSRDPSGRLELGDSKPSSGTRLEAKWLCWNLSMPKKPKPKPNKLNIYRLILFQQRNWHEGAEQNIFCDSFFVWSSLNNWLRFYLSKDVACGKVICIFHFFQNSCHRSL